MPAIHSSKAVLLVHGRGADRTEGMRYAPALIKAGFNVLAIDLRHPRQSPEIISTMGFHEQKDVIAAVDFLERQKKMKDIGVLGFSMGGATSVLAMAKDQRIKAGVFNSPIASVEDVLTENGQSSYGLPKYPLIPIVMQLFSWRGDIDLNRLNAEDLIAEISPRPVFIMHGTADKTVPYHHGEDLYTRAKEPKQFLKIEGGEHTRLWQAERKKTEQSVVRFFLTNI
nr:alpha/beta hydrolase [Endozoicomonas sp. OPT23]